MITTTAALQFNQILRQVSLVITSILLAKSGLSVHDIGIYESLLFIGTTLSYFWLNALIQSSLSFIPSVKNDEKPTVIFNIFLIFNVLSLALFLILVTCQQPIALLFTNKADLPYFNLYAFFLLLNFPPLLLESLWTVSDKPKLMVIYALVSHVLLPLMTVLPLWFGKSFEYSFYGMITVAAIRYIWLIINLFQHAQSFIFSKTIWRTFLILALPLMVYSFLNGFIASFTSWIVNWFYGGDKQIFAIFRYGAREFPLALALATGLSNSMIPMLAQNSMEGRTVLKKKSERLWHILFPTSIGLMLTAKWLFPLVFNPEFAQSSDVFCIFLLLLSSRALFPQTILLALKETNMMLWISIIETLTIIVLCFLFIKPFHTEGVAFALVFGFLLEKILIIWFLKRRYGIDFQDYTNRNLYLLYSFALLISYFVQYTIRK